MPKRKEISDISAIVTDYGPFVWRALRYLGVREADVKDVAQEVFLVVLRKVDEFEGRASLRTWIYAIAVRVAADYRKSAYVQRIESTDALPEAAHPGDAERLEARRSLQALLDQLDDPKRTVVVLHDIEGFSMPEAARIMECPVQTAYTRWHAARARLKELAARDMLGRKTA